MKVKSGYRSSSSTVEGIVGLQSGYSGVTGEWGEGLNFVNTQSVRVWGA